VRKQPKEDLARDGGHRSEGFADVAATASFVAHFADLTDATTEPAAYQLRCISSGGEIAFVISGTHNLWKLNQCIAECFGTANGAYQFHTQKGATVVGSYFRISRSMAKNVLVCSKQSAVKVGGKFASFVDDKSVKILSLFRGTSTGHSLEQSSADVEQRVEFHSPSLMSPVLVRLDGIMPNKCDENAGKNFRWVNDEPLPRIVGSSFLSSREVDMKNVVMLGDRVQRGGWFMAGESQSDVNKTFVGARKRPLFKDGGADFRIGLNI
jgi:hypothetical protein